MIAKRLLSTASSAHARMTSSLRFGFSKSLVQVIMVEDFPQVGFEGQIVKVRPG